MATKPGILTDWPWQRLGNSKYVILVPFAVKAIYANVMGGFDANNICFHVLLVTGLRYLLCQMWTTVGRLHWVVAKYQVQLKGVNFPQVDRERGWEDFLIFNMLMLYAAHAMVAGSSQIIPFWDFKGIVIIFLVHAGPVELLYYWAHRLLHHHFLFTRYHSHHHSSFVPEPITGNVHPFIEHVFYMLNMGTSFFGAWLLGHMSISMIYIYLLWFDFMNCVGHCNWEFVPTQVFKIFPPLKYLMYTPSYHSLHHSRVHTNFSLFMPLYDYLFGTVDKSTDSLHAFVREGRPVKADVVYLSHSTSLLSIFHLPFGFPSLSAHPLSSNWYLWILWPLAFPIMLLIWVFGQPYISDKYDLDKMNVQTWIVPRYAFHYFLSSEREPINRLIEKTVVQADQMGARVISLGLLNKVESLNRGGELLLENLKGLRIRIVDGSTLTVAIVVNVLPSDTREVFLTGGNSKIGRAIATYLCRKGINVLAFSRTIQEYESIAKAIPQEYSHNISHAAQYRDGAACKTWIIGEQLASKSQKWAPPGAHFHQFVTFPIEEVRKDCTYGRIPALRLPKEVNGLRFCEGTLPRYVVRATHAAGILHAMESWNHHEVGDSVEMDRIEPTWNAARRHGFSPVY